eukprot:TRINITY_DN5119_c0_g1_i1.p1 TRINITY_DN5119_c0_g1~~TRINITY_DN5119_c0_g1_i1.p1  ORF type:complete len:190 (+),score=43.35 TRINITY_DN5119_c0_g1_i1:214-783(+)
MQAFEVEGNNGDAREPVGRWSQKSRWLLLFAGCLCLVGAYFRSSTLFSLTSNADDDKHVDHQHVIEAVLTNCTELVAHQQTQMMIGGYSPQCDKDGSFSALQCQSATGMCWCVTKGFKEIENTRHHTWHRKMPEWKMHCEKARADMVAKSKCVAEHEAATKKLILGGFIPNCHSNGTYHYWQCWASTGN